MDDTAHLGYRRGEGERDGPDRTTCRPWGGGWQHGGLASLARRGRGAAARGAARAAGGGGSLRPPGKQPCLLPAARPGSGSSSRTRCPVPIVKASGRSAPPLPPSRRRRAGGPPSRPPLLSGGARARNGRGRLKSAVPGGGVVREQPVSAARVVGARPPPGAAPPPGAGGDVSAGRCGERGSGRPQARVLPAPRPSRPPRTEGWREGAVGALLAPGSAAALRGSGLERLRADIRLRRRSELLRCPLSNKCCACAMQLGRF